MKIQKAKLAKKLNQIKAVVPKKTTLSALQGVLVEDGFLIASDLEMTVKSKLECADGERFLLPIQTFELIQNLPDGEIELSVTGKDSLVIQAGGVKYKRKTLDPDLFPMTTALEGESESTIKAEEFLKSLRRVSYAASSNGFNAAYTSVCLQAKGGYLNFISSDGHVLAWDKRVYDGEFELLLPKNTVDRLKSFGFTGEVKIQFDGKGALFFTEELKVYTRLLDGRYFDYQKKFHELPLHTGVSRIGLLDAMVRVKMCMAEKRPVKFQFEADSLNLSMEDKAIDYHETMKLKWHLDEALTIGFNPILVLETMKAFECENVKIFLGGPRQPVMIEDDSSDFKALVLPVRID